VENLIEKKMAGHSKFKNIMHRKGAQDKKRAKLFSRLIREISVAAKLGGGDPDSNPRLRTAVNNALSSNMAKDNIERAIKKNSNLNDNSNFEEIIYEGFAPAGVAVIVESLTDNRNRSASDIRSTFSKFNGNLGINGCVKHSFNRVGVISYANEISSFEDFFEFCLSTDVMDVEENEKSFDVITSLESYHKVLGTLEKKYSVAKFSRFEWKPLNFVEVRDEDDAKNLFKLLEKLEELDDVQNIASNFNVSDLLMEKII